MAMGGGARAWRFLKRNDAYAHARRAHADGAPEHGDAPFALRRQSAADRAAARFGLLAWEDPFARDGPASPRLNGRVRELWTMVGGPAPPAGRGTGTGSY